MLDGLGGEMKDEVVSKMKRLNSIIWDEKKPDEGIEGLNAAYHIGGAYFMDWNCDIDLSKQRIESEISRIRGELPPDVQITVEKMNPSILQVMGYSLEGKGYSPIEMKMLALYTIKPFLSQVEGVSEVRVLGGKTKEYWVILDQQKMSSLGITPEMVNTALSQSNFIQSNGYLADYRMKRVFK